MIVTATQEMSDNNKEGHRKFCDVVTSNISTTTTDTTTTPPRIPGRVSGDNTKVTVLT